MLVCYSFEFGSQTTTVYLESMHANVSFGLMSSMVLQKREVFPLTNAFSTVNVGCCLCTLMYISSDTKLIIVSQRVEQNSISNCYSFCTFTNIDYIWHAFSLRNSHNTVPVFVYIGFFLCRQ